MCVCWCVFVAAVLFVCRVGSHLVVLCSNVVLVAQLCSCVVVVYVCRLFVCVGFVYCHFVSCVVVLYAC